jgi:transcriptional regulator with XRE-family HTH domain
VPRSAARATLTGTRIRALRMARGLGQADLARLAGVSPSYLNLIEHNRRRAGPDLLQALAGALDLPPEALAESSGAALVAALGAAAGAVVDGEGEAAAGAAPGLDGPVSQSGARVPPELDRIEDFAGRFPGWAGLVAALHLRNQMQERAIERLSDRMAHDPNLAAALSEIVSAVTSVQSTAAILAETDDLAPEWRARFHANIHADSVRLAHAAEALVAWLETSGQEAGPETGLASPMEELESWLSRRGHHLPELEPPEDAGSPGPGPDTHPVTDAPVAAAETPEGDRDAAIWDAIIANEPDLASRAGRWLARDWVERARADARQLPARVLAGAVLAQLAGGGGLDPGALADRFGVAPGLVLRRLAALPPAPGLPRFGLVMCDGSGTLTFRRPVDGFVLPRFGGACPVWPLFRALQQPGLALRELVETTARPALRFLVHAVAAPRGPTRYAAPQAWEAAMLITPATPDVLGRDAVETPLRAVPVGASCRVCVLADCGARREPSLVLGQV